MAKEDAPSYTIFDDYRASQRIAVVVRWILVITWLTLINVRSQESNLVYLNSLGAGVIALNGYLHWRIWRRWPVTWPYVLAVSIFDLAVITVGLMVTSRFGNTFYVFYYPALLGAALIFPRRISFTLVTVAAVSYTVMSLTIPPKVDTSVLFDGDEKELTIRVVCMFAVVVAANLMTRIERQRRVEAVEAERSHMQESIRLQRRAEEAERQVQEERIRVSEEIHNGAAQSAYMLSLGLETCYRMAQRDAPVLLDKIEALHAESKQALWELRYPIDLGPLYEGRDLARILSDHLVNFKAITSIPTRFSATGQEVTLPLVTKHRVFTVAHNALTNIYKFARATKVEVEMACDDKHLRLTVSDNGVGLDSAQLQSSSGHGIRNMRRAAQELGGTLQLTSAPGKGTVVAMAIPV